MSPTLLAATKGSPTDDNISNNNEQMETPNVIDNKDDAEDEMDDEEVLRQTSKEMLQRLCDQFGLSTKGTKAELLKKLRDFAEAQAEEERKRLLARKERVESGGDNEKEKHEIVNNAEGDDEDEGAFFYYESPEPIKKDDKESATGEKSDGKESKDKDRPKSSASVPPKGGNHINNYIAAPPPPPGEPNTDGERVVTVYSTMDQNDLTGVAAAQPGQGSAVDPMLSNFGEPSRSHWETNDGSKKGEHSDSQLDKAREKLTELVSTLLSTTGAPGFQHDEDELSMLGVTRRSKYTSSDGFPGFDPSKISAEMLTASSTFLRASRGRLLATVLDEYELRSVGYDGPAGDDKTKGGGHFREVAKVRTFLEGYRKAEVRRMARETVTLLLDKIASEGIEGLDVTLSTMTRSSDDTSDTAGELNDSLIDYLNDAIRQQEEKVERLVNSAKNIESLERNAEPNNDAIEDPLDKIWKVEDEDGEQVETFDPNNLATKKLLQEELAKSKTGERQIALPKSAEEQLLLLLKLLKERIKIEATFGLDEKSRNLRILAYCCKIANEKLQAELILKEFGSSIDRLDSFVELVASSVEYVESTSYQLQPSKGQLDITKLRNILALATTVRDGQAYKASGGRTTSQK